MRNPSANTALPPLVTSAAAVVHGTKIYGTGAVAVRALDDLSIDLPARRFSAIMGPSGSGKSTLLHCVAGLDTLTEGQVLLDGEALATLSDAALTRLRRDRIGFVFQAFNLLPTLTAAENITLPLSLAGRKPDRAWLDTVVQVMGIGDRLRHRPSELSGGQQQRVAVARALVTKPAIVFADEPTGNLDSRSSDEILSFLRRAVDDLDQTVVMVTHDPTAAGHADEVVILADGRLVDRIEAPTPDAILDRIGAVGGDHR